MQDHTLLIDGSQSARATLILAHGAGAPMDSPFMDTMAKGLAANHIRVIRFEFPYMQARRKTGVKKPPNRLPILETAWREMIGRFGPAQSLFIGGKSMGGRIASMIADESGVKGLICLGYPFHPAGKPEKLRTEHLKSMATPTLILQGDRDPMGTLAQVPGYGLSDAIRLHWLGDGEHSFKPRVKSGRTEAQNLTEAIEAATKFMCN